MPLMTHIETRKLNEIRHALEQLEAENKRLREALEKIVNYPYSTNTPQMRDVAKEALLHVRDDEVTK
tara:strand:- start:802 stop:1002 length:201 start_codon:yes stop_codon:yes gene_type:complete